jgi:hypothetical protein
MRCSMGSPRKSKSVRATSLRPGERTTTSGLLRKASTRTPEEVPEIPAGVLNEIENQRGVLVTVITLLHCLHIVLENREDNVDEEPNPRIAVAVKWASLPEVTAMLLERTQSVLSALDSLNLTRASKAFQP